MFPARVPYLTHFGMLLLHVIARCAHRTITDVPYIILISLADLIREYIHRENFYALFKIFRGSMPSDPQVAVSVYSPKNRHAVSATSIAAEILAFS